MRATLAGMLAALVLAPAATAAIPVDAPVLSAEVPAGHGATTPEPDRAPSPKTVDGDPGDWIGDGTGFAGSTVADHGELIYDDHLWDAYGADDGRDAQRMQVLDPATQAVPEAYRADALQQADVPGELGLPSPEQLKAESHYGDTPDPHADLRELRIAADHRDLFVLARTTILVPGDDTALLLLVDDTPGGAGRQVPWQSGLTTNRADHAILLAGSTGTVVDLATGRQTDLPAGSVATNPDGYTNAIEARIPLGALRGGGGVQIAAATGAYDGKKFTPANVAFRGAEPVREYFDKRQALALHAGTIDEFFQPADLRALAAGETQRWTPGPGYYERIFRSADAISRESGTDGIFQRYGVYLPKAYDAAHPKPTPLQWWLHWRGGEAHSAATLAPRIFKHFGEDVNTIVISPEGRGSSSWYVGKGQVDIEEVRADALRTFAVDPDRVYVTGHSMGGWGSYLLSITHPDWFAAALPVSGPVTQGAWTGLDFPGCDTYHYDEYSFCYIQANDGDARTQHTRRLLGNLRDTPIGIFQGVEDELVPVSGVVLQMERLVELGYRHRFYLFPASEHYTHPAIDQWQEGAAYLHSFVRDPHPERVTYTRDMPFEHATEQIHSDGVRLDFDFDHAYWMSELEPADPQAGVASFDGTSLARLGPRQLTVPEAGGPTGIGQTGPWVMTGLRWVNDPTGAAPQRSNGFDVTLTGASAVRLDLAGMGIDPARAIAGRVTADHALDLRLDGGWSTVPPVTVDGAPTSTTLDADGVLHVALPAGSHAVAVG